MRRRQGVDPRPHLERQAPRTLATAYLGIAGCTILGGILAAELALHLTSPKET